MDKMSDRSKEYDVVLVVPTEEEFRVLVDICPVIESDEHDAVHYHTIRVPNSSYRVVAVMLGEMGATPASQITEKILDHVRPKILVLIGIGAAIDKGVRLGDVIIADEINEFQAASKTVDKAQSFVFQYSGRHWRTDFALTQSARDSEFSARKSYEAWQNSVRAFRDTLGLSREQSGLTRERPGAVVGHIASGNTVVASKAYAIELQGIDRKFRAIEMEAAGVLQAASSRKDPVRTLVARGISDFADERKAELDSLGNGLWRKYAMYSVVMFFLNLLELESLHRIVFEGSETGLGKSGTASIAGSGDQRIELTSHNLDVLDKSLRDYCVNIVDQYENFYGRVGSKPVIEQLTKFDLRRFFVPLSARDLDNYLVRDAESLVMGWIEKDDRKGLLVLGDFGTGKSTLSALIAVRLAKRCLKTRSHAPLFIPLRLVEFVSKETLLDVISGALKTDWNTLSKLSDSGKLVFILDGFDEILKRTDWNKTLSDFQAIVTLLCTKNAKVIVTCRAHYFLRDSDIRGEETSLLRRVRATEDFRIMNIEPLDEHQILEFVKRRMDNPKQIWEQIGGIYNLRDLCKRPLLTDMIVSSLPELVASGEHMNPATLYDTYTGMWIKQEDWRSQLEPTEKAALMEETAFDMLSRGVTSGVSPDSIREIIRTKLKTKLKSDATDYFDYDIRTCSFFNRDSLGNYAFMHRSFLEFFVAKRISRGINSGDLSQVGLASLSREIAYFASFMIEPLQKDVLWNALHETRGKTLDEAGVLGGNAVKLLRALNENFQGQDFEQCAIKDADFGNLTGCSFDKARLENVSFEAGNISDCTFKRSELSSCRFGKVKLSNVTFSGAKIYRTNFEYCEIRACPMRGVRMESSVLRGARVVGVDMTNGKCRDLNSDPRYYDRTPTDLAVHFSQSCLRSVKFERSDLMLWSFHQSNLHRSSFDACNLRGVCVRNCDFSSSRVNGGAASFGTIVESRCSQTRFVETRLYGTSMPREIRETMKFDRVHARRTGRRFHVMTRESDEFGSRADPDLPVLCALDIAVERLHLADRFEEKAIGLYSSAKLSIQFHGFDERTGTIAACLYTIARDLDKPISLNDIAAAFGVRRKTIDRCYREMLHRGQITRVPVDPYASINVVAKKAKIKKNSVELAKRIIRKTRKRLAGRNPFVAATASLYLACKIKSQRMTLNEIALAGGVSQVAVRNVCQILWLNLQPTAGWLDMRGRQSAETMTKLNRSLKRRW